METNKSEDKENKVPTRRGQYIRYDTINAVLWAIGMLVCAGLITFGFVSVKQKHENGSLPILLGALCLCVLNYVFNTIGDHPVSIAYRYTKSRFFSGEG